MKTYSYRGQIITASSKVEAIQKILSKADEDFVDRLKKIGFDVSACIDKCYSLDYGLSDNISVYFKNKYKLADVSIRVGEKDYKYIKNISSEKLVNWCEKNRNLLDEFEKFGEDDVAKKIEDSLNKLK